MLCRQFRARANCQSLLFGVSKFSVSRVTATLLNRVTVQPNRVTVQPNRVTVQPNRVTVQPNRVTVQPNRVTVT